MKQVLSKIFRAIGGVFSAIWKWIPFGKIKERGSWKWLVGAAVAFLLIMLGVGLYLGREPGDIDVEERTRARLAGLNREKVVGAYTTTALIEVVETLLDKPGGYQSNDVMPPTVFMDNIPSWEFGVLQQVRDLCRSLRNDISRSRSQSVEVAALAAADPLFSINHASWAFPAAENKYREGVVQLEVYLGNLASQSEQDAQFYARADNLKDWLLLVEKRLGSLSQRLAASVGQARINTDLAGDEAATQSTYTDSESRVKTPWLEIDNVFYEARGCSWALIHFLQAIEQDFEGVLEKKNARRLVRQIIRELQGTQRSVYSPMVLNGGGFGVFANHSLVMASYVSRANAAVIELRDLLSQG